MLVRHEIRPGDQAWSLKHGRPDNGGKHRQGEPRAEGPSSARAFAAGARPRAPLSIRVPQYTFQGRRAWRPRLEYCQSHNVVRRLFHMLP